MRNFETFTKRMVPLAKDPYVTVQKKGIISINATAYSQLNRPVAVILLFDVRDQVIGLRSADTHDENAYPIRDSSSRGIGPYVVSGVAFTKYYGIDTTTSRRWPAQLDGDVLCVDISKPGTEVVSNRNRKAWDREHAPDGRDLR